MPKQELGFGLYVKILRSNSCLNIGQDSEMTQFKAACNQFGHLGQKLTATHSNYVC
jgi:hypothetical protein